MLLTMRPPGATMKISDLLSPTDVMIDVRASNKPLLLQEFAAKAADSLGLPVDQIAPYLLKREELGSTGIGKGVAIPHVRLPELQRPHGLLAKLKQPIEFDAIDGEAVDLVFVLLLPDGKRDREQFSAARISFPQPGETYGTQILEKGLRRRRTRYEEAQGRDA